MKTVIQRHVRGILQTQDQFKWSSSELQRTDQSWRPSYHPVWEKTCFSWSVHKNKVHAEMNVQCARCSNWLVSRSVKNCKVPLSYCKKDAMCKGVGSFWSLVRLSELDSKHSHINVWYEYQFDPDGFTALTSLQMKGLSFLLFLMSCMTLKKVYLLLSSIQWSHTRKRSQK